MSTNTVVTVKDVEPTLSTSSFTQPLSSQQGSPSSVLFYIHCGRTDYWGRPLFHQSCFTSTVAVQTIGAAPSFIKAILHPLWPYRLLGPPPLSSKLFYIHCGRTDYWGRPLFHQSCFTSTVAVQTIGAAPSFIKAVLHPLWPYRLLGPPPLSSKLFYIHRGHTDYEGHLHGCVKG